MQISIQKILFARTAKASAGLGCAFQYASHSEKNEPTRLASMWRVILKLARLTAVIAATIAIHFATAGTAMAQTAPTVWNCADVVVVTETLNATGKVVSTNNQNIVSGAMIGDSCYYNYAQSFVALNDRPATGHRVQAFTNGSKFGNNWAGTSITLSSNVPLPSNGTGSFQICVRRTSPTSAQIGFGPNNYTCAFPRQRAYFEEAPVLAQNATLPKIALPVKKCLVYASDPQPANSKLNAIKSNVNLAAEFSTIDTVSGSHVFYTMNTKLRTYFYPYTNAHYPYYLFMAYSGGQKDSLTYEISSPYDPKTRVQLFQGTQLLYPGVNPVPSVSGDMFLSQVDLVGNTTHLGRVNWTKFNFEICGSAR